MTDIHPGTPLGSSVTGYAIRLPSTPTPAQQLAAPAKAPLPNVMERGGIKTARTGTADETRVTLAVTASGASVSMTLDQAHEAIDQLAWQLRRYDLASWHHRANPANPKKPT